MSVTKKLRSTDRCERDDAVQWVSTTLLVVVVVIIASRQLPIISGDTRALADSAPALVECVKNGSWSGCPGATQFGIVQYLPAMFLAWRGVDPSAIVTILALVNLGAILLTLRMISRFQAISLTARGLLINLLVASPLIVYSVFSFGEASVSCLGVVSVVALFERRSAAFVIAASLAVASRETAVFYVAPLLFAVLLTIPNRRRADIVKTAIVLMLGLTVLTAFNFFKFGTWKSPVYSDPILRVNDLKNSSKILVGVFFSPNGGFVWYWPLIFVMLLVAVVFEAKQLLHTKAIRASAPVLLVLTGLVTQVVGLSNWFAPFGWVAWGPRLMIPSLAMAAAALVVILERHRLEGRHQTFCRSGTTQLFCRLAFVGLTASSSVAAFGFLEHPTRVLSWFGHPDETCPNPAIIQVDRAYYFRCLLHGMWRWNPSMYELSYSSFRGGLSSLALGLLIFCAWRISGRLFGETVTDIENR